jgi:hypothetical protein
MPGEKEADLGQRYGINPRVKSYPQDTPKAVLKSVVAAIENADYSYLVAQLLEPRFVDDGVADRGRPFEAGAEADLTRLRDYQRANANTIALEDKLPTDPQEFRALVVTRARTRGFKVFVREIEQKLTDDPQVVKDFRRVLRDTPFPNAETAIAVTHPDLKGRSLYFKKIGTRWFLENRQVEEKKEP